ncbi:MAG: S41 family peptidase [Opitutaceae bacterium]|nr:S41 family peptidase [Opitutaceae bacterium]
MIKRLLLIAVISFLVGEIVVYGVRLSQGRISFPSREAKQQGDKLADVMQLINENYVTDVSVGYDELTEAALEGIVRSLDPHSDYLSQQKYEQLITQTDQKFGGIGIQIEMKEDALVVVAPISNTPGERAGLMRGDEIVRINTHWVKDLSMDECLGMMRGKRRTKVDLEIFRPRTGETFQKTIIREIIKVDSVRGIKMVTDRVGYIWIALFGERTGKEFLKALEILEEEGMTSLVLDLRNNPGGLLDAAVEVAQPFFDRGELVVYTQGRMPESRLEIKAKTKGARRSYPIAVLINSGSASASEIVAGALKDTQRAVIVGETSFGKGSVQRIFPLSGDEALRLTTSLYYTPGGELIHGNGVEPHILMALSAEEDQNVLLQRSRLEVMSIGEFAEEFGFDPIEDSQLKAAIDALEGVSVFEEARLIKPVDELTVR